jgi:hypothetical protein
MDEGMLISSPATVRGNRGRFGAVLGCLHGLPTRLRTDYARWKRNKWRRAMNRLASAQVKSRRCVFFFSPR